LLFLFEGRYYIVITNNLCDLPRVI